MTTSVNLEPLTFWRKQLLVHRRRTTLAREIRASLAALEANVVLAASSSGLP